MPKGFLFIPFVLSAVLFLSGLFSAFAPLPILVLYFETGRVKAWLAAITNAVIIGLVAGKVSLWIFVLFVLVVALVMSELLNKKISLEKTGILTLASLLGVLLVLVFYYSRIHHMGMTDVLKKEGDVLVEYLNQNISKELRSQWLDKTESSELTSEFKETLLMEFPPALAITSFLMIWINLFMLLRLNPKKLREKLGLEIAYFRRWKAPEFLIWPTLFCGFLQIVEFGVYSQVALGGFKFLMAIYALQGLSVLSFLFEVWRVGPLFRILGFVMVIVLMLPLLLGIGFFDLWFDFRAKLRQS